MCKTPATSTEICAIVGVNVLMFAMLRLPDSVPPGEPTAVESLPK